jgi:riboflavin biosynthesis pyrimidine reductase
MDTTGAAGRKLAQEFREEATWILTGVETASLGPRNRIPVRLPECEAL